ncbi:MFS transporter, MCP family, solute carrier family 16, member 10 [Glonium stellatum]|uniref:MFS transporter, MCP family, solute carrier family 16, member 10 n=1 Tax=Glonium stellatum TaxID=574774 RepID=A0A8E2JX24_9PEZI|nr:MFS transporter, MCP family, solute carrier family 16, member 10 [Glonium stellatum]
MNSIVQDDAKSTASTNKFGLAIRTLSVDDSNDDSSQLNPPLRSSLRTGNNSSWLQALGGFLIFFNIWGIPVAWGVFQSYYVLEFLPHRSASDIAWIGTIQGFFLIIFGTFGGPLYDLGYFNTLAYVGTFLTILGMMLLSISTSYSYILLSQGFCVGFGCGLLYIPSLAFVGEAFKARRAIAMGIVTSGSTIGAIVYTIVFQQLLAPIGFAWTVRVMGLVALLAFLCAAPTLLRGPKKVAGPARSLIDYTAFKDVAFITFTISQFFVYLGYLVPLFYIPTYAQVVLHTSENLANRLLMLTLLSSTVGRLSASALAQCFGVMLPWVICCVISGISCLVWIYIRTLQWFVVWCVLFGAFSGALVSLPPAMFPRVCPDLSLLGTRMGMSWPTTALAFLIGTPIAGAIVNLETANLVGMQVWSGVCMLIGAVQLVALWVMLSREHNGQILI